MRLACYGWVDEQAGSVGSASYVVVNELLRRGYSIDLYANQEHVRPPGGLLHIEGFDYVGLCPPPLCAPPAALHRVVEPLLAPYWRRAWGSRFGHAARQRHGRMPYDAVLTLGVAPAFHLAGVPTVTWLQGPLQTEFEAIRRLRPVVCRVSGRRTYLALCAYYKLRARRDQNVLDRCDEIVCGSEWSKRALARWGVPLARLHAIPYPVDLETFSPDPVARPVSDSPVLLSLGRLDPRKRLDLLVAGFEVVADAVPGARLRVVGRPGYAPGQASLIERSPWRHRIEHLSEVPRASVPELLRTADILVQPSENENFGSAVAEALACGVPVVVGRSNGTADYIDVRSAVFSSYTADDLAQAILAVLDRRRHDPEGMRRSARASAERWLSVGAVVDSLEAVLQQAVLGPRGGPRN